MIADICHRDHATFDLEIRDLIDSALAHLLYTLASVHGVSTVIAALARNFGRCTAQIAVRNRLAHTARSGRCGSSLFDVGQEMAGPAFSLPAMR